MVGTELSAPERGAGANQNENDTEFTIDEATEVLRSERRRRLLEYLDEAENGEADLSTVAEAVAEFECGTGYSAEERKRVYIALYQSHVPKLEEYGVVEDDRRRLSTGPAFEKTVRFLRALQRVEDDGRDGSRFRRLKDLL